MGLLVLVTVATLVLTSSTCAERKDKPVLPALPPVPELVPGTEPIDCQISNLMNAFSFDLQKAISENDNGNMVFSPYSIYSALALLKLGAANNTKNQIRLAMKWTRGENRMNSMKEMHESFTSMDGNEEVKLNVANNGWLGSDFKILESFRERTNQYFGVKFERDDFGKPEAARKHINKWVRNHTGKRIIELFPSGSFTSMTKLVLANAIYFKGQWTYPFKKRFTLPSTFYREDGGQSKNVNFMYQSDMRFLTGEHRNVQLLELPYGQNEEFSMLFAKPQHPSEFWRYKNNPLHFINITRLSNEVDETLMKEWLKRLRKRKIDIFVPRFTMKKSVNLVEKLQALGITDAFSSSNADLSRIAGKSNLFVSSAEHKAFIEVDEEGTKAAGATGLGIMLLSMPPTIKLDRPFLFFILHKRCNSIIFAGRVADPGV